jgi:hypothetical protein
VPLITYNFSDDASKTLIEKFNRTIKNDQESDQENKAIKKTGKNPI